MLYELVIVADTNDADYVTSINTVNDVTLGELLPIVDAIKNFNANHPRGCGEYNWRIGEYASVDEGPSHVYSGVLTEDQIDMFTDLCPHGEYGIHTIESIEYYPLPAKVKLL